MRKHFPLTITCMVLCAGLLAACDKGPDPEQTKPETQPQTEEQTPTEEQSQTEKPSEGNKESRSDRTNRLSKRALGIFSNQCLNLYYSNSRLMEYENDEKDDSPKEYGTGAEGAGIAVAPGTSLYFRIDAYEYGEIYQITYSSDESFARSGQVIYSYDEEIDRFRQTDHVYNTLSAVSYGVLVIPDEITDFDEKRTADTRDIVRGLWKDWQSDEEFAHWPINVKYAYLMPFYLDECGKGEVSIFLELEDGTWTMGYITVGCDTYDEDAAGRQHNVWFEWKNDYKGQYRANNGESLVWLQYYRNPEFMNEGSYMYFDRFYCPDSSGYTVYDFSDSAYPDLKVMKGAPSDGSFLASVPDLRLEELPLEDSLANVPGSESGVKEEILSYDYDKIIDRLMVRMKNRCLEWYYSGVPFATEEGQVRPKPGSTVNYDIYLHRPSMTFWIQCYEGEECPEEWIYSSPRTYSENYVYMMRDDCLIRYPGYIPMEEKISSGSFTVPDSFETGAAPKDSEDQTVLLDEIRESWKEFKEWYDEAIWPEYDHLLAHPHTISAQDAAYCSEIKNAYLMPFSVEEDDSFEFYILIEMDNGNWFSLQADRPSEVYDVDVDGAVLERATLIYLKDGSKPEVDSNPILSVEDPESAEFLSKVPEMALEKLY